MFSAPHSLWSALQERQPGVLTCPSPAHKDHALFSQAVNQAGCPGDSALPSQAGLTGGAQGSSSENLARDAASVRGSRQSGKSSLLATNPGYEPGALWLPRAPSLLPLLAALKTRRAGVQAVSRLACCRQGKTRREGARLGEGGGRARRSWACSVLHQRQRAPRRSSCTALPWGGDPESPRWTLVKGALPGRTGPVWFL